MVLTCVKMIHPITEKELINSEKYLVTPEVKPGDVLEQTITLQREGLDTIEVAFVFEENLQDACKALVEIVSGEEVLMKSVIQVNLMPDRCLTPFLISGGYLDELTVRITNISEEDTDMSFSLLYTDSGVRMLDHVTQFKINNQIQKGQLISQYTYNVGWDYYEALSVMFWIILICMALEKVLLKNSKENSYEM